jgi:TetR/AcrR family transcriptional repressor of nem operon
MTKISAAETGSSAVRTGRKTRRRPGQDRRQALVEAAYRRIAECGFEGLRLRDVAAEVGIDHSTIHHYFPTKQSLVTAVVDYATRQFWTSEPRAEAAPDELRRQLTRLARMIVERPELHIVVRELDLRARRDAEVRAVVASREEGWRASLAELFAAGAPAGAWAPAVDPAVAGELVIAAVKGASLDPEHAAGALRQLERLLIGG